MDRCEALVVMGVSGSGKTYIGRKLAERLGIPFFDGDDFHPPANLAKMRRGMPLNDADRAGWLKALHNLIQENLAQGQALVLACSALKAAYRETLQGDAQQVCFIYLKGNYELILERIQQRRGHFFKPELLASQFATLEEPQGAIVAEIEQTEEQILDEIIEKLRIE